MLIDSMAEIVGIFFFLNPVVLMSISYEPRAIKKRVEAGEKRFGLKCIQWVSEIAVWIMIIMGGIWGNLNMPKVINRDFEYAVGVVQSFKVGNEKEDVSYYQEVEILQNKEEKTYKHVYSPEIIKGDKVKLYLDSFHANFVSEINGEEVLKFYNRRPVLEKNSSIFIKISCIVYVVVFGVVQICLFRIKKKEYNISRNNLKCFVYKNDLEKIGFEIWKSGCFLYILFIAFAVIGIGNSKWLGILTMIFGWLYLFGYWMVYMGRSRGIIYYPNGIYIQESCGYVWKYSYEQIKSVNCIKNTTYILECVDGRKYPMNIHNEKQIDILRKLRKGANKDAACIDETYDDESGKAVHNAEK